MLAIPRKDRWSIRINLQVYRKLVLSCLIGEAENLHIHTTKRGEIREDILIAEDLCPTVREHVQCV